MKEVTVCVQAMNMHLFEQMEGTKQGIYKAH